MGLFTVVSGELSAFEQRGQPEQIAPGAETANLPAAGRRDDRGVAERLAGMDVAEVDLDGRQPHGGDRVPQRVGIVRERAGVDQDALGPAARLVDGIDQRALVVRLEDAQRDAPSPRQPPPAGR